MKIIYENCGVKNYMREDLNFFWLSFRNCKSCVYNCYVLLSYNYLYFADP